MGNTDKFRAELILLVDKYFGKPQLEYDIANALDDHCRDSDFDDFFTVYDEYMGEYTDIDPIKKAKLILVAEIKVGDRVFWTDPADVSSGSGTVTKINGETVDEDTVISVNLDGGSELECYPHELEILGTK